MATYKKHGKRKTKEERIEDRSSTAKVFGKLDNFAGNFEDWVSRNRNPIFGFIGLVVIGVLGYLAYNNFIVKPRQQEAVQAMSEPLDFFNRAMQIDAGANRDDMLQRALNGAGGYGLLDVANKFGNTDAGNIANYTAGMAYLNLRQYKEAVQHLEKFSSKDEFLAVIAKGAIGDAFTETGQTQEALKYYEEAAKMRSNNYSTPKYLFRAALAAIELGQMNKAETFLKQIEKDYPLSPEAEKVPVYLGLANN